MSKIKKLSLPAAGGIGAAAAAVLTVLLCLPGAALAVRGLLPVEAAPVWAAGAAGVSVCAAAAVLSRLRRRQALPTAGIIAAVVLLLAAVLCALGGEEAAFGPWLGRLGIAVCAGGLLGAVMSLRQNSHGKRRRP